MYVGETGHSVKTRKSQHADTVKTFNTKKSATSQNVIDWDVKTLKSELHNYRRHVANRFLVSQKTYLLNVINYNDGGNFPVVYSMFTVIK